MGIAMTGLLIPQDEAEELISRRILLGEDLLLSPIRNTYELERAKSGYSEWNDYNTELLKRMFGIHEFYYEYSLTIDVFITSTLRISDARDNFKSVMQGKLDKLSSIKSRLPLLSIQSVGYAMSPKTLSANVLLIHGRDETMAQYVAKLLEKCHVQPIFLLDESYGCKTMLEMLEHTDAGFAVVLLTQDDTKQNTLFELGYLVGKLGRGKVCVLSQDGLELPYNAFGIIHIPTDAGNWTDELANAMKAAGYPIDRNTQPEAKGIA